MIDDEIPATEDFCLTHCPNCGHHVITHDTFGRCAICPCRSEGSVA